MKPTLLFTSLLTATSIALATDHLAEGHVAIRHTLTLEGARTEFERFSA